LSSKKTLNAKNLEALGAERLAGLLIEISSASVAAKRRLRLELAGAESPGEVAKEVRKRLTTIARSRSFIDGQNRRALVDDLRNAATCDRRAGGEGRSCWGARSVVAVPGVRQFDLRTLR
jgi:hypothetical protein